MRFILSLLMTGACLFTCYSQSINVDPLTGRANIQIPIWELTEGNLSVPISIAYNGGGVRVSDGEGSAGMSWNVIADGAVYRELRGLPDDYDVPGDARKGWISHSSASSINSFNTSPVDGTSSLAIYNFIAGNSDVYDKEPDVFSFNAPGLSGSFVFGVDKLPKLLTYQDLKFEITRTGGTTGKISQIKITNSLGIAYTFSTMVINTRTAFQPNRYPAIDPKLFRTDWYLYATPLTFTTSWKLTSITSPTGASISFGYSILDPSASVQKIVTVNELGKLYERYRIRDEAPTTPRLSSITTNAVRADFDWDQNKISSITINDSEDHFQKKYSFVYKITKDFRNEDPVAAQRQFLTEIKLEEDCATLPSYQFSYWFISLESNNSPIPYGDQNRQDYWGYYNGGTPYFDPGTDAIYNWENNFLVPKIYCYNSQSGAEKYRLSPIPGQTPNKILDGIDRAADTTAVITGSLSTIKYPTGAIATINFQSNRFYDDAAAQQSFGGGVRVRRVVLTGAGKGSVNSEVFYEYKQANKVTSGKLMYRPVFAFAGGDSIYRTPDNLAPDDGVIYTRTTRREIGKGRTIFEFDVPAVYPDVSYNSAEWIASESKLASSTWPTPANQQAGNYTFPFAQSTNYDFERGLLRKTIDSSEVGTKVSETLYDYARLSTTPLTIRGIRFEFFNNAVCAYAQTPVLTNLGKVTVTETTKIADEVTPSNMISTVKTYAYSSTHRMLESISTTNSDGITYKTKYKYARDFSSLVNPDGTQAEAVAMKSLNDNFRHGEAIETIQSRIDGATELVTGASLLLYKNFSGSVLPYTTREFPPVPGFAETGITGSPQRLSIASQYRVMTTVQSYNSIGMPLNMIDYKKTKAGIYYGYQSTTAVATVGNAYAEETVYCDFETVSATGLTMTGSYSITPGWTGANARSIFSSAKFRWDGVQKGTGKYRFSCWVKSAGTPTITFKAMDGSTMQSSGTVVYSGGGQWQYREAVLDMGAVSSSFSLEVGTSSATTEFDDIRFYPINASLTTSTEKRLTGTTSASDDRGISTFKEYDELGRLRYVKDRNKDIVQVTDYKYRSEVATPLSSNFTSDYDFLTYGDPETDEAIDFTAPLNCNVVNYAWKVDGVQVSTDDELTHTFDKGGYHTVELTVSTTAGTVSTTKSYCVAEGPGDVELTTTASITIDRCEPSYVRTIEADNIVGCDGHLFNENIAAYQWYYKFSADVGWTPVGGNTSSLVFDVLAHGSIQPYSIKCVVSGSCTISHQPDIRCEKPFDFNGEGTLDFFVGPIHDCE